MKTIASRCLAPPSTALLMNHRNASSPRMTRDKFLCIIFGAKDRFADDVRFELDLVDQNVKPDGLNRRSVHLVGFHSAIFPVKQRDCLPGNLMF